MSNLEYKIEKMIDKYRTEYEFSVEKKEVPVNVLRKMIEHTNLKPQATPDDIERLCEEAKKHDFLGVCVNPSYVSLARKSLEGTDIRVVTVIGFPLGATDQRTKALEAKTAMERGADEFDMVIHVGMLKAQEWEYVYEDIKGVVESVNGKPVKVILETGFLTPEEIISACVISKIAGAKFVKTSTGFGPKGATVEDVHLMKWVVGDELGVKAAGGIRTYEDAVKMYLSGANRIGTSSGVRIVERG